MTKEEIASILKKIRIESGLTQKEAAEKLGRKQQTLASWETGQSQPDANTLFVLCTIYGVTVDEAFGFKKSNQQKASYEHQLLTIFEKLTPESQDYLYTIAEGLLCVQEKLLSQKK